MQPTDLQLPILLVGSLMVLPAIPPEHSLKRWLPNVNWDHFHFELRMWWQLAGLMLLATVLRDISFAVPVIGGVTTWASSVLVGYVAFTAFKHFVSSWQFPLTERYAILFGYLAIPLLQFKQITLVMLVPILAVLMLWQMRGRFRQWSWLLWGWVSTVGVVSWLAVRLPSPVETITGFFQQSYTVSNSDTLILVYLIGLVLYFGVLRELNRILH